jgi:CMP-N-acetylneuraminic acid synthetase
MTFTLATICARGGSQGVEGKNIKLLRGHPLVAYTIAVANQCPFLDRVVVSTDSDAIAAVARRYGAEVPFMRPAELASATSAKIPAIQHAVGEVERSAGHKVDYVVDLDPTAPLRTVADVRACWEMVQQPDTDVVLTVREAERSPYFNMVELDAQGYAHLSKEIRPPVVRRQDAPRVLSLTASVYAYRREHLMRNGTLFGKTRVVTTPPERSHDIDTAFDFTFVEFLVSEGHATLPELGL